MIIYIKGVLTVSIKNNKNFGINLPNYITLLLKKIKKFMIKFAEIFVII